MRRFLAILVIMTASPFVYAQTVRGTVKDVITGEPLPGAVVVVAGMENRGAVTDADGEFVIADIPIGRYSFTASCLGYESQQIVEILVSGTKEAVLSFHLRELAEELQAAHVRPVLNKARPINPTALAGASMISVEEATRFAGAFDDISRVVRRYVGTTGSTDNNGISTHGNPASATQYRLEGVEIPSPIHFDGTGGHGTGMISALHTECLANSDYYTSAPPAEMGNTLGGVMDLQLRAGNPATWEHSAKISTLGLDLTSEGPLSKNQGSSYLATYRYGLSKLANDLGIGILDGDQGDYHDLAFKLSFSLNNASSLHVWGLGTWDKVYMVWDGYDEPWQTLYDQNDFQCDIHTLTGGLTYDALLRRGWRLRADLAAAHRQFGGGDCFAIYATDGSLLSEENRKTAVFAPATPFVRLDYTTLWLTGSVSASKRFSPHYLLKLGSSIRHIDYEQTLSRAASVYTGVLSPLTCADESMQQVDAYVTNNLRFGAWTFNAGLHLSGWTLSEDWSLQPRLSAQWVPSSGHTLSLGYGMTTRMESYDTYFASAENRTLRPMRSQQAVLGYGWQPDLSFKLDAEAWTELQSDVPVSPHSTYTALNRRLYYTTEPLVNAGKGRSYGLSLGVEHYMTQGVYWLVNGTVFKVEYQAEDQIWRPTLFDRGWAVNAVGGKEWTLGARHVLSVNIATTAMGGIRQSPFDEDASAALYKAGIPYVAYDENRAMERHSDPVVDLSLNISYRIHAGRLDHIIGFDYLNMLGMEEPLQDYWNAHTGRAQTVTSCYSLPNISYCVEF